MDALNLALGGNVGQYITAAEVTEGEEGGVLVTYTIGSHLLSEVQEPDFQTNLENGMKAQPGLGHLYSIGFFCSLGLLSSYSRVDKPTSTAKIGKTYICAEKIFEF